MSGDRGPRGDEGLGDEEPAVVGVSAAYGPEVDAPAPVPGVDTPSEFATNSEVDTPVGVYRLNELLYQYLHQKFPYFLPENLGMVSRQGIRHIVMHLYTPRTRRI
jgi:hypothetical protein